MRIIALQLLILLAFLPGIKADNIKPGEVSDSEVAKFTPDFKTWDVYLPHLNRTHLSGWWKLNLLDETEKNPANDKGTQEKFYAPSFDDSSWENIVVPGHWHRPYMRKHKDIPGKRRGFSGVGWFRLKFTAPAVPAGDRAILHFDEVVRKADVFLNGKKVGSHSNYRLDGMHTTHEAFDIDVTDSIISGKENILAVRVFSTGLPMRWGWGSRSGIVGRVYLDIKPAAYCKDILITPDDSLKGLSYDCFISADKNLKGTKNWTVEVFEWNSGKTVAEAPCPEPVNKDNELVLAGRINLPDAKLWSCESPFLYGLRFKDSAGKIAGLKRFGMRTFKAKDGNFLLNGKPTMLRGVCVTEFEFTRYISLMGYLFVQNEGDAFKRYFKAFRDANINHIRFHSSLMAPVAYDLFDELGFLVTDELSYPSKAIKNPKVADKIAIQGIDYASYKDGRLRPEFVNRVKSTLRFLYSHPSIATFSFGNEMRGEGQCGKMFNNLYDLYKKLDKQDRPLTPSSGRFWKSGRNMASLSKIDKLDYIDTHDYTGSINNFPISFCEPIAKHFIELTKKYYRQNFPPIVNGETLFFQDHYYRQFYGDIWKSEKDAEPNWEKYIWVLSELNKKYPDHRMMSYYWIRNWGTRNYKYHQIKGRAIYTERTLDVQRKLWPNLDGYEILCGKYFSKPTPIFPLSKSKIIKNEAYDSLKQVCAPAVAVLDYIAPNRYSGEMLESTAHIINNSEEDLADAKLIVSIQTDGKALISTTIKAGKISMAAKKIIPLKIKLPEEQGTFSLSYKLKNNGKVLCDRKLEINLRKRDKVFAPIQTDKKILVYDAIEKIYTGMGRANTTKLLKEFKVPFTSISDFDKLPEDAILIIGASSLDSTLDDNADKIKDFLTKGGRALVFEQSRMGRIPFLNELEYVQAGPGQFAEKIRQYHPSINGMSQNEFFCWNQKDWSVYHSFVTPLSEAAVLVGGDSTTWGADNFGMVVSHMKVGKGTLLLSQADITSTYTIDSGAAQLARQLLKTVLDDKAVKEARKFRGNPVIVEAIPLNSAEYISLASAANMAFSDHKAGDGKGGWTDQGPRNDLNMFPTGFHKFGGSPFKIIDPKENNGKSCIVVSANKQLKFKASSTPIPVGKKLKRMVFLHSGAWMGEKGTPAGKYIVKYSSGKTVEIPLAVGIQIADWWNAPSRKLPQAECVWSGNNISSVVGAYAFSWTNPAPREKIESITVKASGNTVIGLLALTGEKN